MTECGVFSPDSQLACRLDVVHEGWHQADGSQWHGGQWGVSSYDDTQAVPVPTSPLTEAWSQDGDDQWHHPQWWTEDQTQSAQVGMREVNRAIREAGRIAAGPPLPLRSYPA